MKKWLFRGALVFFLFLAFLQWALPLLSPRTSHLSLDQRSYVIAAYGCSLLSGINPSVFERQIWQESGFRADAVSSAGAQGIAQFMPSTARAHGVDVSNPLSSLCGAARLDASYLHTYQGNYAKMLGAYNAGPGRVDWAMSQGGASWCAFLPAETQQYILNILLEPCS